MRYHVISTPQAEEDLREIFDYVQRDSPLNAARLLESLSAAVESLAKYPLRSPLAPENETYVPGARHLIHWPYRVIFLVRDKEVRVIGIRHGARLPIGAKLPEPDDE